LATLKFIHPQVFWPGRNPFVLACVVLYRPVFYGISWGLSDMQNVFIESFTHRLHERLSGFSVFVSRAFYRLIKIGLCEVYESLKNTDGCFVAGWRHFAIGKMRMSANLIYKLAALENCMASVEFWCRF